MKTVEIEVTIKATVPEGKYCTEERHWSYWEGDTLIKKVEYISPRCEKLADSNVCSIFGISGGGEFGDITIINKCQQCLDACKASVK